MLTPYKQYLSQIDQGLDEAGAHYTVYDAINLKMDVKNMFDTGINWFAAMESVINFMES